MPEEQDPTKQPPATGGDADADKDSGAKKALEAERAARRKADAEAKAARDELAKLQASLNEGKTDAERMVGRVAELEKGLRDAEMARLRAEVAQEMGLNKAQAKRLQGNTIEELEADAKELLEAFKPTDDGAGAATEDAGRRRTSTARPTENLRPGATPPGSGEAQYDSKQLLADVPRG